MNRQILAAMPASFVLVAVLAFSVLIGGLSLVGPAAAVERPNNAQPAGLAVPAEPLAPKAAAEKHQAPQIRTHTVVAGETLSDIAARYGVDVETLLAANPNISGDTVYPGDELVILPQKGVLHTVVFGDTLWRLANLYGVEVERIREANGKQNDFLAVGEKVFVPGGRVRYGHVATRGAGFRFIWPTQGEISSLFGQRWGRLHAGLDIANDIGTPVRAARAGRVIFTGWKGGYGYTVMIEHGAEYTTLYGHLADYVVTLGQYVETGQLIAYMGNTGYSTGPHLHFEVRRGGQPVNPLSVLP
ncbi:peptidase M23B [Thermosinus carboxydivorans Nor1]|uniref:Peptidase M23B n=1 Tax=Thermosinus carboxydivorans Nor1 TaxID=401526 RepID=A1HRW7_9FIRM|nr:M23 family metallopeptidase [Thermosinus carboxydivorans]EAX47288.1 peptidase M23B [Thermosinus carboxydivorans Nor1]